MTPREQNLKAEIEAAAEKFAGEQWKELRNPRTRAQSLTTFALSQVHAQIERDAEMLEEVAKEWDVEIGKLHPDYGIVKDIAHVVIVKRLRDIAAAIRLRG